MVGHLLRLVWHRKRANGLMILEIFFSFLVLFVVVTWGVFLLDAYRRPLGFSYDRVWTVGIETGAGEDETWTPSARASFPRLLGEVRAMDEVEIAAGAFSVPYDNNVSSGIWDMEGRSIHVDVNEVTDDFSRVMGLTLVAGRWFEEGDSAMSWRPVVIDREMSADVFGSESPLGRALPLGKDDPEQRVVGVVTDFRKEGELSAPANYLFRRIALDDPATEPPRNIVLKLRPGVPRAFEETLTRRLHEIVPEWTFEVRPLEQLRQSSWKQRTAPVIAGGVVAGFLMMMVGLGLVGVLWQNVTQRTREIGLRRATGATRAAVRGQILLELALITTGGLLLGVIVVVQLPILQLVGGIGPGVFATGLLASAAAIYLLALLCGLYPSMLATRVRPVEALHHE